MSITAEHASPARLGRRLLVLTIALAAFGLVRFAARSHAHSESFPEEGSHSYGD
jgi:hypothetical protein